MVSFKDGNMILHIKFVQSEIPGRGQLGRIRAIKYTFKMRKELDGRIRIRGRKGN